MTEGDSLQAAGQEDLLDFLHRSWHTECPQEAAAGAVEVGVFVDWVRRRLRELPIVGTDFRHGTFGVVLQDGSSFALVSRGGSESPVAPTFPTATAGAHSSPTEVHVPINLGDE